ncbi:hypothetical protein [Indiicoccus explosivorum]|uniref:hypothetical protein n=1 Tax=Indiicoccus explosivorum TaxID=1917864 RepID=UPI000B436B96|nr:hypothetical protein [Indiicoccus explosivorum]
MKSMLSGLLVLLLVLSGSSQPASAAMEPEEVERVHAEAPLHLTGEVTEDVLLFQNEEHSQTREMTLEIEAVLKQPENAELPSSLPIQYTYIPSWVQMTGGEKMDIAVGDRIEIWLEPEDGNWHPVLSGTSVKHLYYIDPRSEHMRKPFLMTVQDFLEIRYPFAFILVLLVLVFLTVAGAMKVIEDFHRRFG